jgi:hypothetical protein
MGGVRRFHQSRANLAAHIVVVPVFLAGNVGLLVGIIRFEWIEAPVPFSSAANALSRIVLEQWVTFPRFVLTGRWWRALRAAA